MLSRLSFAHLLLMQKLMTNNAQQLFLWSENSNFGQRAPFKIARLRAPAMYHTDHFCELYDFPKLPIFLVYICVKNQIFGAAKTVS